MKKIVYWALVAVMATACSLSKEQKAEDLIRESLKTSLYKPETYKPVETKVDSAFAPYDDPAFFEVLMELDKLISEYDELEAKVKYAKSLMARCSGPYQSEFDRNNYREAKENFDDAKLKIEKIRKKVKRQYEKVVSMLQVSKKFVGYKAIHNYRAENNAGNTLIGDMIFIIDKDFKEVLFSLEVEDYNQLQDAIKNIEEELEEEE